MLQGTAFCSRRSWWSLFLMTSRRVAWSDAESTHSRGSDAESEGLIALHRCVDLLRRNPYGHGLATRAGVEAVTAVGVVAAEVADVHHAQLGQG